MARDSNSSNSGTRSSGRARRSISSGFPDAPPPFATHETASEHALQLARAAAYIERNLFSQDLTPESVAEAVHVSRSGLYRLFQASGGVHRYVMSARLDRAWSVLADPHRAQRVSVVAFDCGFRSEAHFCRAFRRAFGVTPGFIRGSGVRSPGRSA
jgi:AraC-like DNA-binding protein